MFVGVYDAVGIYICQWSRLLWAFIHPPSSRVFLQESTMHGIEIVPLSNKNYSPSSTIFVVVAN